MRIANLIGQSAHERSQPKGHSRFAFCLKHSLIILIATHTLKHAEGVDAAFSRAGISTDVHRVGSAAELLNYLQGIIGFADRRVHPWPMVLVLDLDVPETVRT